MVVKNLPEGLCDSTEETHAENRLKTSRDLSEVTTQATHKANIQ